MLARRTLSFMPALLASFLLTLAGCATSGDGPGADEVAVEREAATEDFEDDEPNPDPFEPMNRAFFAFNESLDEWDSHRSPCRASSRPGSTTSSATSNVPILANDLLQGKPMAALQDLPASSTSYSASAASSTRDDVSRFRSTKKISDRPNLGCIGRPAGALSDDADPGALYPAGRGRRHRGYHGARLSMFAPLWQSVETLEFQYGRTLGAS